jgi:hypothetical protein
MPRVKHHRLLSSPLHDLISFWHADNNSGHPMESLFFLEKKKYYKQQQQQNYSNKTCKLFELKQVHLYNIGCLFCLPLSFLDLGLNMSSAAATISFISIEIVVVYVLKTSVLVKCGVLYYTYTHTNRHYFILPANGRFVEIFVKRST